MQNSKIAQKNVQSKKFTQYFGAIVVSIGSFINGTILAWTSPAFKTLSQKEIVGFEVTQSQFDFLSALMCLGAIFSFLPIGFLMDKFGRQKTLTLLVIPFVVSWSCIIWATNVETIFIGRFLNGFAGGSFCIAAPLYTSEIAEKEIRGQLSAYYQLFCSCGVLFTYIIGAFCSLNTLSFSSLIISIIYGVLIIFQPETPYFYCKKGQIDKAKKSLEYLRGNEYNLDLELNEIIETENRKDDTNNWDIMITKPGKMSIFICLALQTFQQGTCIEALLSYSEEIFEKSYLPFNSSYGSIIIGIVSVLSSVTTAYFVDSLGRKALLIISSSTTICCLSILTIYFSLDLQIISQISILPVITLGVFFFSFSLGFGSVLWIIIAEIIPAKIKREVTTIVGISNWFLAFLNLMYFNKLVYALGMNGTFLIFVLISFLGLFFIYFFIPETKGKSFLEIQELFEGSLKKKYALKP